MINKKSFSIALFFILANLLLAQSNIPENAEDICPLLIGEKLPDCNLVNENGENINLDEQIKKMNTVLVFILVVGAHTVIFIYPD